ncbi:ATP-binding protein [Roseateles sp. MS654]|uniref:ATP-binding protein n=1 Tax=Roseateles sp. MS654 TaxID=3412685 RepID=UPI003C2F609B
MKTPSLSRQLVRAMTSLALLITLGIAIGSYGFYYLLSLYYPLPENESDEWALTAPEVVWIVITGLLAVAAGAGAATKLAKRILVPLNSVAESLKKVAHGDLTARAAGGDPALGEVTNLVEDFNLMANQLERLTQEQAQWSAAIAHELRTPVTILRGRLQGLADGVFEPSQPLFLKLLSQVEGLSRLIEDLRVLGLSNSGHLHLHIIETDLAAEVRNVVDVFEPTLEASGHRVALHLGAAKAFCDPIRIRQVLLALLENASKYATAGEVRVTVDVSSESCTLRVEDDGPGVPAGTAQRMFDAFWRAEASRSRNSGGSGLGLAVVAAIARAHRGNAVCVPSATGGTAIELSWPNHPAPETPLPSSRELD